MINPQIFLDFNGVLDSSRGHYGGINFDPNCVQAFNQIATPYSPHVIIISTWRLSYSQDELQQILERNNMLGRVVGKTPDLSDNGKTRGDEIQEWRNLFSTDDTPMLVLEDYANIDPFENYCVRPRPYTGLSMDDATAALAILKKQYT